MRLLQIAFVAFIALANCGCSVGSGNVKGTVSYKGKLLSQGRITLTDGNKYCETVDIQADGSYSFTNCPTGKLMIGIESENPVDIKERENERKRAEAAGMPMRGAANSAVVRAGDPSKWIAIPASYAVAADSGLTVDVSGGENEHNINLE